MKTIFVILMLLSAFQLKGQFFVLFQPQWVVLGGLYNQPINNISIYVRAQYGDINYDGLYADYFKFGSGITYGKKDLKIVIGVNYNTFLNESGETYKLDLDRIKAVGLDIGVKLKVNRLTFITMTDLLNWETTFGVNYKLKRGKKHEHFKSKTGGCVKNYW